MFLSLESYGVLMSGSFALILFLIAFASEVKILMKTKYFLFFFVYFNDYHFIVLILEFCKNISCITYFVYTFSYVRLNNTGTGVILMFMANDTIEVVSLNVNGICAPERLQKVTSKLIYPPMGKSPHIVCLQETHLSPNLENQVRNKFQYESFFAHESSKTGGLYIGFNRCLEFVFHAESRFSMALLGKTSECLLVHCSVQGRELVIVNAYTHPRVAQQQRVEFWIKVGEEAFKFDCPNVICCGDFNSILDPTNDTLALQFQHAHKLFQEFIEKMEWVDSYRILNPMTRRFTHFCSSTNSGNRLDYIFITGSVVNELLSSDILPKLISDHNPVSIKLSFNRNPKGPGYWKFPDPLLKNPKFIPYMRRCIKEVKDRHGDIDPGLLLGTIQCSIRGDTCDFLKQDGLEDKIKNEAFQDKLNRLYSLRDSASPAE